MSIKVGQGRGRPAIDVAVRDRFCIGRSCLQIGNCKVAGEYVCLTAYNQGYCPIKLPQYDPKLAEKRRKERHYRNV